MKNVHYLCLLKVIETFANAGGMADLFIITQTSMARHCKCNPSVVRAVPSAKDNSRLTGTLISPSNISRANEKKENSKNTGLTSNLICRWHDGQDLMYRGKVP